MEIYLMRHAQTTINKRGKVFCGITDAKLSEEGKELCRSLSSFNIWNTIDEVYVSSLSRTFETAKLIFNNNDISVIEVPEFSELNFGDYEGKIITKENKNDPIFKQWLGDCSSLKFPNGESISEHAEMSFLKLKEIVENSKAERILIVSHATTIRLLLIKILELDLNAFRKIPCSNAALTKLKYDGEFHLEFLNVPLNIY